jgi:hypothetical protein
MTNTATITLAGPNTPLGILQSNLDVLVNAPLNGIFSELAASSAITITFNQAIDPNKLRAQLLDDAGANLGNMTPTFISGNIVTLAPPAGAFAAGKRTTLVLHAVALSLPAQTNGVLDRTVPVFISGPATVAVTATLSALTAGPIPPPFTSLGKWVLLTFSEHVGLGMAALPLTCVAWYDPIDLDNPATAAADYQGEFGSPLPACPSAVAPIGALDITKISIYETSPLVTSYSNKWFMQVDDSIGAATTTGCKTGAAAPCTKPVAGTMLHLLFSHLGALQTFHRANGQPVPDIAIAIQ